MSTTGQAVSAGIRERAVRMVLQHQQDYESQWKAICSVAEKLGPTAETAREWVRRAEIDGGVWPGVTTAEAERIRQLERARPQRKWLRPEAQPAARASTNSSTA
jgi:transposase